jgi:hypothetical protein
MFETLRAEGLLLEAATAAAAAAAAAGLDAKAVVQLR